ncbi:superoxide dismutase [Striga asiatica]|uniref:superoxide dismutase n=1 Tax=Striga asiatica TaxID=4170 RepID=A0A5A7NXD4_STRAF|nr:superoxide dismutase [Striga asiatica]
MAELKPDTNPSSSSGKYVKAPNLFERVKEEFEAVLHNVNQGHHKETHGLRDDIDGNSSIDEIKAPNVLERAKEEIEAIVSSIHPKKKSRDFDTQLSGEARDSGTKDSLKPEEPELHSEKNVKAPNVNVMAEKESELPGHKPHHHRETHGTSDDIDENTPISEVKGPNVFERAKEEIEALIHTIHPKKDSDIHVSSDKTKSGFPVIIGKGLEKVCSPRVREILKPEMWCSRNLCCQAHELMDRPIYIYAPLRTHKQDKEKPVLLTPQNVPPFSRLPFPKRLKSGILRVYCIARQSSHWSSQFQNFYTRAVLAGGIAGDCALRSPAVGLATAATSHLLGWGRRETSHNNCRFTQVVSYYSLRSPPYKLDALEPYISQKTLEVHWGAHHRGYVETLNKQLSKNDILYGYTMDELIRVTYNSGNPFPEFNNAAQVWNHDFFWESMQPGGGKMPTLGLLQQIEKDFASFDNFKEKFTETVLTSFASSWVWLVLKRKEKCLAIVKTSNAVNPLVWNDIPIICLDMWEHAYYLDYKNDRGKYVNAFMNHLVSWDAAAARMARAQAFVNLGEPKIPVA